MNEIRIYIEGGGDHKNTKRAIRCGFGAFLRQLRDQAQKQKMKWQPVVCGSRNDTYDDFKRALRTHTSAFNVLLIDAEGPVTETPWMHLHTRDGWTKPENVGDDQCHLMTQTIEAWIIADVDTLVSFYGQGFNRNSIPKSNEVETIPKDSLASSLKMATRKTQKGEYHKIRHASKILERLNAKVVRSKAPHCDRLFETVETIIKKTES